MSDNQFSRRRALFASLAGAAGLAGSNLAFAGEKAERLHSGPGFVATGASADPSQIFLAWKDDSEKYDIFYSTEKMEGKPADPKDDISAILNCKLNDGGIKYCTIGNLVRDKEYQFKVIGRKGKQVTFDSQLAQGKTTFRTVLVFDRNSFTEIGGDKAQFNGQGGMSLLEMGAEYGKDAGAFVFADGGKLKLVFPLYMEPSKANLTLELLSSGLSGAFNGGYSPFALRLNGELVNIGSPGFHDMRAATFEIKPRKGENTIELESLMEMPIEYKAESGESRIDYLAAHSRLWLRRVTADCIFGEFYNKPEDLAGKLK